MLFVASFGYSQEKIPLIDYNSIAQQIPKTEGNEKVLELINKISKNDSAYYSLLASKSYYLLQLKKYEEALGVVNEGIKGKHKHSKVNFFVNKGTPVVNTKGKIQDWDKSYKALNNPVSIYKEITKSVNANEKTKRNKKQIRKG